MQEKEEPSAAEAEAAVGPSSSSAGAATSATRTTTPLPVPIKGDSDWRAYECVRLDNGVTVCVARDRQSRTTAASAAVRVGAAHDPRRIPGLAHFLEHMCFLGSGKYPGENEYKRYLSQHGGRSNASTSLFVTNYKFEVLADHAELALDMFAQFFVDPLLTASATGREANAVDSENSKNLTADARRRLQCLKDICLQSHYFTKFTTGNLDTLLQRQRRQEEEGEDVEAGGEDEEVRRLRQALLRFHAKHYTPDRLTVTVVGPQSTDELLGMVVPRFAAMKARRADEWAEETVDPEIQHWIDEAANDPPPFGYVPQPSQTSPRPRVPFCSPLSRSSGCGTLLVTQPVKSQRRLVLMFPMPPPNPDHPDRAPASILSHLLGHEGPGSSFALLQNQRWITALSSGLRTSAPDFALFQVDLQLTPEGEAEWKQVVSVVLQHALLIRKEALQLASREGKGPAAGNTGGDGEDAEPTIDSPLHDAWDESATLSRMFFHHASPGAAYEFAPHLCDRVVAEGTERCLSAGRLLQESRHTLPVDDLADCASRLTIDNCFVERCSETAWQEAKAASVDSAESSKTTATPTTTISSSLEGYGMKRKTEKWYGIDYFHGSLSRDDVRGWTVQGTKFLDAANLLALPRPNRYVPRTLDLCPDLPDEAKAGPRIEKPIDPPSLLVSNRVGRLWHRLDDRYALPKSVITILIRNAALENTRDGFTAGGSIRWRHDDRAAVLSSLLAGMYNQAQAQELYDADLAGLHWSLSLTASGILISCSGFSDRLSDLAVKILADFYSGNFLQESYFLPCRDRVLRGLKTFLESRRADSDAMYYRDLLLAASGRGVDSSLAAAEASSLQAARDHHLALVSNEESSVECLFSGNVSRDQALIFFDAMSAILPSSRIPPGAWIPGSSERRLTPGSDIELHFASRNPQEENGAVVVSYQSSIPGFCGDQLSSQESLESTAAIRLICFILREPLFDELRTKQTLGYVVSSYYDVSVSSRNMKDAELGPLRVPVDFLVINVLSRKLSPPEVVDRIDSFLDQFRDSLLDMPESSILTYATALSTQLLKPIQKLGIEAAGHFSKISRFSPELLDGRDVSERDGGVDGRSALLPWTSVESLAGTIKRLRRDDVLRAWDRLVLPQNRARLVSCVYGSTFPLDPSMARASPSNLRIVNYADRILASRGMFPVFVDKSPTPIPSRSALALSRMLWRAPSIMPMSSNVKMATAMAAVVGAGIAAGALFHGWRKAQK